MTTWTRDELDKIGRAEELQIASVRRDGTLRKPVTIWVVRHGDDLYVRSGYGRVPRGFAVLSCATRATSRLVASTRTSSFEDAAPALNDQIAAAYRTKYRRHEARWVDPMVAPRHDPRQSNWCRARV